jgi:hypothetical protein
MLLSALAMGSRVFDILYLTVLSVLFLVLFQNDASPAPYAYDESDYMAGARLGWAGNYFDTNAMSFPEFVQTGLKAVRKEINRTQLSEYVRSRRDPLFLRHYHGPLNEYWLVASSSIGGAGEHWMRLASYAFYILTFATIYLGILWVFGPEFRPVAVAASLCYLFCVNNILCLTWLSSHVPYAWLSILTLFATAKFAAEPAPKRFYWALGLCVASFCAVEYAGLLFVTLAGTAFVTRKKLFAGWVRQDFLTFARNTILVTLVLFLILWPSSILKLTILQGAAYTFFMVRRGSYAGATPWDVWRARFDEIPMDMVLLCVSLLIALIFFWRSPRRNQLLPFVLYSALLGLTTLKNTNDSARYISSLFAPLYVTAAVLTVPYLRRVPALVQGAALAALGLALLFISQPEVAAHEMPNPLDEIPGLIAVMRAHPAATALVPVDDMPTLRYYFPRATIKTYMPDSSAADVLAAARGYEGACVSPVGPMAGVREAFPGVAPVTAGNLVCYFR